MESRIRDNGLLVCVDSRDGFVEIHCHQLQSTDIPAERG